MTRWQLRIAALAMLGATAALAQMVAPVSAPRADQPAGAAAAASPPLPQALHAAQRTGPVLLGTDTLRRARVQDAEGAPLGAIRDFVLVPGEGDAGRISHVVMGLGGVFGLGRHAVAVPYSELQITPAADGALRIRLPWTEAQLRSVPAWDPANPASLGLSGPGDRVLDSARDPDAGMEAR